MAASPDNQAIDLQLMQGVASSDPKAIERLYDRFASLVYRMAYQALPSRDDAEDAVQEIFVRLWRTAGRYDPQRAALVTWVMLISRRFLVDRLRRAKAGPRTGSLDEKQASASESTSSGRGAAAGAGALAVSGVGGSDSASGGLDLEQQERFAELMKRIERLPELQRTVVKRAYLNGQTLRQIGEELNTPLGTIKSALSRALVRLREREWGEDNSSTPAAELGVASGLLPLDPPSSGHSPDSGLNRGPASG